MTQEEIWKRKLSREKSARQQAEALLEQKSLELYRANHALARERDQLHETLEELERASRSKSEFITNVSHEIRTPMTAILGYAEEIEEESASLPDKTTDAIRSIRNNGELLLHIINDILDLSKIEAGVLQLEELACRPSALLDDIQSLLGPRAEKKGLSLEIEMNGPIPTSVASDPMRLRQILINLVGNAIKFTLTGGIRVAASFETSAGDAPSTLTLAVRDTGIGIEADELSKIFEPFAQADNSLTRQFGGTGLGLAISQRLAKMLGGNITLVSTAGKGSTFTLTIPCQEVDSQDDAESATACEYRVSASPAREAANTEAGSTRSKRHAKNALDFPPLDCRVLLVEDGPDNQRIVMALMKKFGATVTLAENGSEAINAIAEAESTANEFDIVLMDMQMPVLDGYDATKRLRARGYDKPIIALTAHAMSDDRQKCLDAGCDDYDTKPINRKRLYERIASNLKARRAGV